MEAKLRERDKIPNFFLKSSDLKEVSVWDYSQKKNLILFFFHGVSCEKCLIIIEDLVNNYVKFKDLNTEILGISIDSPKDLSNFKNLNNIPFPLLSDQNKKYLERFTYLDKFSKPVPAVFIADKFGILFGQYVKEDEKSFPPIEEYLNMIFFIESQCEECGH